MSLIIMGLNASYNVGSLFLDSLLGNGSASACFTLVILMVKTFHLTLFQLLLHSGW